MSFSAFDDDKGKITRNSGQIAFSRPGLAKLSVKTGAQTLISQSDGERVFAQFGAQNFASRYAGEGEAISAVLEGIPSALSLVLPALVAGENPLTLDGANWQKVAFLAGNGVALTTQLRADVSLSLRLYFDENDRLLRRVEAQVMNRGQKSLNLTTLTSVETNPQFAPGHFNFSLPPGAKLEAQTPNYDPKLKVGAAPFPLAGRDLGGKTVDLEKYAGKVVLLDFWATWCGPCIEEVPNLLQNLKNYREAGFEIVGVSLDEDKAALQAFVKARGLNYPHIFDGKGWKNADAQKYGVMAIPFTLLIGKDGKIAAVNPRGRRLEPAIVKALAG